MSTLESISYGLTAGQTGFAEPADGHPLSTAHDDEIERSLKNCRIIYVDGEHASFNTVLSYLKYAGFDRLLTTTDTTEALWFLETETPDLVLVGADVPNIEDEPFVVAIRRHETLAKVPIIFIRDADDTAAKCRALELGAADFVTRPVDRCELLLRVRGALEMKLYRDQLCRYSDILVREVRLRTTELEASRKEIIRCLAQAAEYRDDDTGQHIIRVGKYAAVIARGLGFNEAQVEMIEQAAQLHDVGKIGIPDAILLKPKRLDPDEFNLMRKHCRIGQSIIEPWSPTELKHITRHTDIGATLLNMRASPVMQIGARIAQTHHEKWDGSGYPRGLTGEEIPIEGRITAVADVFDALSSRRPYKQPFPQEKCFRILEDGRGIHFDPRCLDAFFTGCAEILTIQVQFSD